MENQYIINNGELYHYGVLGMKWDVHRAKKTVAAMNKRNSDIKSFNPYVKSGIKDKKGRVLLTPDDVRNTRNAFIKMQAVSKAKVDQLLTKYGTKMKVVYDKKTEKYVIR